MKGVWSEFCLEVEKTGMESHDFVAVGDAVVGEVVGEFVVGEYVGLYVGEFVVGSSTDRLVNCCIDR